ncbi:MAG: glycosyltransferase [Janthinobacterium lividum]
MPRFANMLAEGMKKRGHQVEILSPEPKFYNLPLPKAFKKWLGYLDQYIVFPAQVRKHLKTIPKNSLFVLTDHALGPWLPLVSNKAHIVHCHDFIAQQSVLGLIPENNVSWSGKLYQNYIRKGYVKAKNFISVSKKTQSDLHQFVEPNFIRSEVVYNGLNQSFSPKPVIQARIEMSKETGLNLSNGYLLHIGGNQFYKNRTGVIAIYDAWRDSTNHILPLLLIGESPGENILMRINASNYKSDIYTFNQIEDRLISSAYSGATVFLFPSLTEGFGWPIAEAMACGCPVITTNEAPMTEVAGYAGFLIPKQALNTLEVENWAINAAKMVEKIISFSADERQKTINAGIENAKRFTTEHALDQVESIYKSILAEYRTK